MQDASEFSRSEDFHNGLLNAHEYPNITLGEYDLAIQHDSRRNAIFDLEYHSESALLSFLHKRFCDTHTRRIPPTYPDGTSIDLDAFRQVTSVDPYPHQLREVVLPEYPTGVDAEIREIDPSLRESPTNVALPEDISVVRVFVEKLNYWSKELFVETVCARQLGFGLPKNWDKLKLKRNTYAGDLDDEDSIRRAYYPPRFNQNGAYPVLHPNFAPHLPANDGAFPGSFPHEDEHEEYEFDEHFAGVTYTFDFEESSFPARIYHKLLIEADPNDRLTIIQEWQTYWHTQEQSFCSGCLSFHPIHYFTDGQLKQNRDKRHCYMFWRNTMIKLDRIKAHVTSGWWNPLHHCMGCHLNLPNNSFSQTQLKNPAPKRRCIDCAKARTNPAVQCPEACQASALRTDLPLPDPPSLTLIGQRLVPNQFLSTTDGLTTHEVTFFARPGFKFNRIQLRSLQSGTLVLALVKPRLIITDNYAEVPPHRFTPASYIRSSYILSGTNTVEHYQHYVYLLRNKTHCLVDEIRHFDPAHPDVERILESIRSPAFPFVVPKHPAQTTNLTLHDYNLQQHLISPDEPLYSDSDEDSSDARRSDLRYCSGCT